MSSHFRKLSLLLLTGLVTGFGCMGAFGQVASDLRGRIVDPSDAGVAGAQVVATEMNTGISRAVTSGADGNYVFPGLQPGRYRVAVTAAGFAQLVREGVTLVTGTTTGLDLKLSVGGSSSTVTVTADALLLQSETSNIQTTLQARRWWRFL